MLERRYLPPLPNQCRFFWVFQFAQRSFFLETKCLSLLAAEEMDLATLCPHIDSICISTWYSSLTKPKMFYSMANSFDMWLSDDVYFDLTSLVLYHMLQGAVLRRTYLTSWYNIESNGEHGDDRAVTVQSNGRNFGQFCYVSANIFVSSSNSMSLLLGVSICSTTLLSGNQMSFISRRRRNGPCHSRIDCSANFTL